MREIGSSHHYELREVIGLTGLSKQVLHAWERRYGIVQPRRRADGARIYSDSEVRRLQLLKKCIEGGNRIGKLASQDVSQLKRTVLDCHVAHEIAVEDILAAIRSFDTTTIENRLSVHFAGLGPIRFAEQVVVPLMNQIGVMWERGESTIEAEHYVTAIVRTLLGQGLRLTENTESRALAIFATPEGELHELGALMAAMLAQSLGIRALYLGPQLPAESVRRVTKKVGASIICLSSTYLSDDRLNNYVSEFITDIPHEVELWLGGRSFQRLDSELYPSAFFFSDVMDYQDAIERFRLRMARYRNRS